MKPATQIFECSQCGAQSAKWQGRCFECGAWGSLVAGAPMAPEPGKTKPAVAAAATVDWATAGGGALKRLSTGISEFDRVLGGGFLPGSLVLLSGEPGVGKSTLLAQVADAVSGPVLYASGEESAAQVRDRLERLGCHLERIRFLSETNVDRVLKTLETAKPTLLILDSVQTAYTLQSPSEPGSVGQIRAVAARCLETAKVTGTAIVLVGHITKDGQVAGPKALEHIVDAVLALEHETTRDVRVLRATKNRFGSVNEVGIFEMTAQGYKELKNPSAVFLDAVAERASGAVVSAVLEGTRPFFIEIQALVTKTPFGYPQRKASGFDLNRLQVLCAVLTKRGGMNLGTQDVIVNVVGGFRVNDPGLDLAVCLAIASSLLNQTVDAKTVVVGEVGLSGEVRAVPKLKERLQEAKKLGYERAYAPGTSEVMKVLTVKNVSELKDFLL